VRSDKAAAAIVGRPLPRSKQGYLPQQATGVRIEGVDTVVFCNGVHHVVRSLARNGNGREIQRLGVDDPIYRKGQ
jgi:hypothetical protein